MINQHMQKRDASISSFIITSINYQKKKKEANAKIEISKAREYCYVLQYRRLDILFLYLYD